MLSSIKRGSPLTFVFLVALAAATAAPTASAQSVRFDGIPGYTDICTSAGGGNVFGSTGPTCNNTTGGTATGITVNNGTGFNATGTAGVSITGSGMLTVGTGLTSLGGNLNVNGTTTLNNTTTITAGGLNVTGNTVLNNNLNVNGSATFQNNVGVTGTTTTNALAIGGGGVSVANGAPVSMGGNRVQNVAAPVAAMDAANKSYVDTGDAALQSQVNQAFKSIDENTEGIAVAIAMGGIALPAGKDFAIGANVGFYDNKQAFAASAALKLDEVFTLNGGIGLGADSGNMGGRLGVMAAW